MARGFSVFVNIGGKLLPSLGQAAQAAEARMARMGQRMRLANAEAKAQMRLLDRQHGNLRSNAQDVAYGLSAPMAILTGVGSRAVYQWSKVGNELQAVTQMSDGARKRIEALARSQIGDPTENLRAALDLARTGFSEEAIAGSLKTTIKLGKADSSVDTSEAADILSNVMVGMNLDLSTAEKTARQAERIADILAFASAKSSTDIRLMGESYKYAAPLATRLGIEAEELGAAFMTMADAGIKGSESGVAFRSMLVRLVRPTKGGMAVLERLGINRDDFVKIGRSTDSSAIIASLLTQGIDASGQKGAIDRMLSDKSLTGGALVERLTDVVSTSLGEGAGAMDRDKIADGVTEALLSGVDQVDFVEFIRRMRAKGATTADLLNFFDTRQGGRVATLFAGGNLEKNLAEMPTMSRGFLEKMFGQQNKGVVGAYERLIQSFGNVMIKAAESGVIDTVSRLMNGIANAMDRLSKLNPKALEMATYGIMGLALAGPALIGAGAVASGVGMLGWGTGAIGGLMGAGGAAAAGAGGAAAGAGGGALMAGAGTVGGWLVALGGGYFVFTSDGQKRTRELGFKIGESIANGIKDGQKAAGESVAQGLLDLGNAAAERWKSINWLETGLSAARDLARGIASGRGLMNVVADFAAERAVLAEGGARGPSRGPNSGRVNRKRALGGPVMRGIPHLVGERGAELFVPGMTGRIMHAGATAALLASLTSSALPAPVQAMAASSPRRAAPVSMPPVTINIYGATDPQAVAAEVQRQLRSFMAKMAREQRGLFSD